MAMPVVFDPNNFPLIRMPRRLQKAVMALHFKVKAPIPICVISILSAASIACSASHRVTRFNGLSSEIALFLLAIGHGAAVDRGKQPHCRALRLFVTTRQAQACEISR